MNDIINDIYKDKHRYLRIIYNYVKDYDLCEDLLQDAIIKFINSIRGNNYKDEGKPMAYFNFICQNVSKDYLRRKNVRPLMVDYEETYSNKNVSRIEIDYDKEILSELINNSLRKTKLKRRVILRLRIEGWKYDEIADMMNVPMETVKAAMFYMRKKIKDNLKLAA